MKIWIRANFNRLRKCEVKMAGYWPSYFCVSTDQGGVEIHKLAKKRMWSIKELLYGFRGNQIFLAGHGG